MKKTTKRPIIDFSYAFLIQYCEFLNDIIVIKPKVHLLQSYVALGVFLLLLFCKVPLVLLLVKTIRTISNHKNLNVPDEGHFTKVRCVLN
jgi:hypothetical protein